MTVRDILDQNEWGIDIRSISSGDKSGISQEHHMHALSRCFQLGKIGGIRTAPPVYVMLHSESVTVTVCGM